MKKIIFILFLTNLIFAQEIPNDSEKETNHLSVKISDFNWLANFWVGEGLDGYCEEVWLPAIDNAMHGIFRFVVNGKIIFTEYMILEKLDDNIYLKIKHFNRDLSAWEEKDQWTIFPFIKLEDQKAYFKGITFERLNDQLTIQLTMKNKDVTKIETFVFIKNN